MFYFWDDDLSFLSFICAFIRCTWVQSKHVPELCPEEGSARKIVALTAYTGLGGVCALFQLLMLLRLQCCRILPQGCQAVYFPGRLRSLGT